MCTTVWFLEDLLMLRFLQQDPQLHNSQSTVSAWCSTLKPPAFRQMLVLLIPRTQCSYLPPTTNKPSGSKRRVLHTCLSQRGCILMESKKQTCSRSWELPSTSDLRGSAHLSQISKRKERGLKMQRQCTCGSKTLILSPVFVYCSPLPLYIAVLPFLDRFRILCFILCHS